MDEEEKIVDAQFAKNRSVEMLARGCNFDQIISYLKEAGFSQGISSFILQHAANISHGSAKYAVLHSKAWEEVKEANINLQNATDDFLGEEKYD